MPATHALINRPFKASSTVFSKYICGNPGNLRKKKVIIECRKIIQSRFPYNKSVGLRLPHPLKRGPATHVLINRPFRTSSMVFSKYICENPRNPRKKKKTVNECPIVHFPLQFLPTFLFGLYLHHCPFKVFQASKQKCKSLPA